MGVGDRKYVVHLLGDVEKDNTKEVFCVLERAQIPYNLKETIYYQIEKEGFGCLQKMELSTDLLNALLEIPT